MSNSFSSLADLAIIILAGSIGGYIAVKSKLPSIVGYILAGLIISIVISILGVHYSFNSEFITQAAQLGIAFLLFAAGIEFSVNNITKIRNLVVIGVLVQTVLVIIFGALVMQVFGLSQYEAFFIGVVGATSSTAFVLKMLEQNEELSARASNIMVGWLVMQDILIIALFLLLKTYAPNEGNGAVNIIEPIIKAVILIVVTFFVGRFIVPKIFEKIAETRSQEILLISVVALSVGFALLTELLGISYTLGAFLTGIALSDTFLRHEIFTEIKPLRDLFSMIFFVSIGTLFQINTLLSDIPSLLGIIFLLVLFKIVVIIVINILFNIHPKNAIKVGLGLSQIGEFAFLAISIGFSSGWINEQVYSIVLIATIVTMTATPFLYSYSDDVYNFVQGRVRTYFPNLYRKFFLKHLSQEVQPELTNHIIICGFGKVGRYVAKAVNLSKEEYVIIEMDSNLVQKAALEHQNIIFGDATNLDILIKAGIKDAKAIVVALPETNTLELSNFVKELKKINSKIEIVLRTSNTLTDSENISSIVEPEFEAAIRIINKLESLISEDKYSLTRKIRNFRKREIKEAKILEAKL